MNLRSALFSHGGNLLFSGISRSSFKISGIAAKIHLFPAGRLSNIEAKKNNTRDRCKIIDISKKRRYVRAFAYFFIISFSPNSPRRGDRAKSKGTGCFRFSSFVIRAVLNCSSANKFANKLYNDFLRIRLLESKK